MISRAAAAISQLCGFFHMALTVHGIAEHGNHLIDGVGDVVGFDGGGVALAFFPALFGVRKPVVDAFGQCLGIVDGEKAALAQRKLGGSGVGSVCDNRYGALLDGLEDGEAFDLDIRAVDGQVCLGGEPAQFVVVQEDEGRLMAENAFAVQLMGFLLEFVGQRTVSCKYQVDAAGEPGVAHGPDQGNLVFFVGQASDADDFQRALGIQIVLRGIGRPKTGLGNQAVGDDAQFGGVVVFLQPLAHFLRGAVDVGAGTVDMFLPEMQQDLCRPFPARDAQVAQDVFREQMERCRQGPAQPFRNAYRLILQHEILFQVDHVSPADGLFDAFGIAVGIGEAIGLDSDLLQLSYHFPLEQLESHQ